MPELNQGKTTLSMPSRERAAWKLMRMAAFQPTSPLPGVLGVLAARYFWALASFSTISATLRRWARRGWGSFE